MTAPPSAPTRSTRGLAGHHVLGLVGGAGLAAIALFDAATHGLTGSYSVFSDDSGNLTAGVVAAVVHGACYAALCVVLVRERATFAARRVTRWLRLVLLAAFAFLAVGFLVLSPIQAAVTGSTSSEAATGPFALLSGVVGTAGFAGMLLGSLVLGASQVRRPDLGIGGRILAVAWPVLLGTVALMVLGSDWAHPGYLEATVNTGIALCGVGVLSAAGPR